MMISFSVESREYEVVGLLTGTCMGAAAGAGALATCRCMRAREATRIFSQMSRPRSCSPEAMPSLGLATKSIAPSSSARIVVSAPR